MRGGLPRCSSRTGFADQAYAVVGSALRSLSGRGDLSCIRDRQAGRCASYLLLIIWQQSREVSWKDFSLSVKKRFRNEALQMSLGKNLNFYSISSDGRVTNWTLMKNKLDAALIYAVLRLFIS